MEPRIQYAQTADGVSIAFWTLGEGMPLIMMPPAAFSHVQLEWRVPEARRCYERLAESRKLVRYDVRGTGLSQRDVTDFYSLDSQMLDLQAVVDRLGLESFALFGFVSSGPAAIAYAARHPERVSHLILWCSYARGSDYLTTPQMEALIGLIDKDWELFTETLSHARLGWSEGEPAQRFAELVRESFTPAVMLAGVSEAGTSDVTGLLSQIGSPTLVLHRRHVPFPEMDIATGLASRLSNACLVLLEGTSILPYLGDMESVLSAIDEFLGEGEEAAAGAEPLVKEDVHTILFTDMEGSTTLTQRLGDAKAQEVLRAHNRIVRDALKTHSGSEIKHTGDGIMASFASASRALECAIAIQRAFAEHNESNPETPIRVRIGLNAGEPVAEEEDLFGTAVQLAARICAHAEPGEILAPIVVRELAAGKGFLFSDRGDVALRGFEDPVRLYEVRWREEG
jgi:class 3 adenylate cyclase